MPKEYAKEDTMNGIVKKHFLYNKSFSLVLDFYVGSSMCDEQIKEVVNRIYVLNQIVNILNKVKYIKCCLKNIN